MTWGDFVKTIKDWSRYDATPFIAVDGTADAELKTFIQREIEEFSRLTKSLFFHNVQVATATGWTGSTRPVYNLIQGTFWQDDSNGYKLRVFDPIQVAVGGRTLLRPDGLAGPLTEEEAAAMQIYNMPEVANAADVKHWIKYRDSRIRLVPGPSGAFSSSVAGMVSGFVLHPVLTSDSHEVYFRDDKELVAARYCWTGLLRPNSVGTAMERLELLDARTREQLEAMMAEAAV